VKMIKRIEPWLSLRAPSGSRCDPFVQGRDGDNPALYPVGGMAPSWCVSFPEALSFREALRFAAVMRAQF
jgi:hypothetical protein